MQFAAFFQLMGGDSDLLFGFPNGGLERRFTGFDATTGAVDFSRAKTAFFSDEEDFLSAQNKAKDGAVFWLPGFP